MTEQQRHGRGCLSLVVFLVVGIIIGAGAVWAHFSGSLAPLYHKLGWHAAHQESQSSAPAGGAMGGHAGHGSHGGGSMAPAESGEPSSLHGYSIVKIAPERQQLIGVRTGKVECAPLLMSIRAVGVIEPDQTRLARIHTRISGWVTKVHVNFVGQSVQKGDPLVELYSPDLMQTQLDYLLALDAWETQGKQDLQKRLMDASRRRLELWGVPADEIEQLEKTRKARETLMLRSPIRGKVLERNVQEGSYVEPAADLYRIADLSVVWLQAKVYEFELPHIEVGQPVTVSVSSQPDRVVKGKVSFIEPVFQEATRTVKVRVAMDNNKDEFKPGMYANLVIDHDMGHGLQIPESGLLRTGERDLAFRVLPGNRFEPVEVKLGSRFKDRWQVLDGLSEGDEVVTSAAFLIDAESRLKSATAAMSGHQHGSGSSKPAPSKEEGEMKHQDHKGHESHDQHKGHGQHKDH
jgi:Cu(I)/Ag(I) efflux system membrane fusion protein